MYVFTDAGPKEADKFMDLVMEIALGENLKINFFSTGESHFFVYCLTKGAKIIINN